MKNQQCDGRTDESTDRPTERVTCRVACTRLKILDLNIPERMRRKLDPGDPPRPSSGRPRQGTRGEETEFGQKGRGHSGATKSARNGGNNPFPLGRKEGGIWGHQPRQSMLRGTIGYYFANSGSFCIFYSLVHATLYKSLSIGRSVCWLVRHAVEFFAEKLSKLRRCPCPLVYAL